MFVFRTLGLHELMLVYETGMKALAPRLPEQPFLYLCTAESLAIAIARDWNAQQGASAGFVARLDVDEVSLAPFERRDVGGNAHAQVLVPAESVPVVNAALRAPVAVSAAFFGAGYAGVTATTSNLRGRDARRQRETLAALDAYSRFDFVHEITANHGAVFANYFFWESEATDAAAHALLAAVRSAWTQTSYRDVSLGVSSSSDASAAAVRGGAT